MFDHSLIVHNFFFMKLNQRKMVKSQHFEVLIILQLQLQLFVAKTGIPKNYDPCKVYRVSCMAVCFAALFANFCVNFEISCKQMDLLAYVAPPCKNPILIWLTQLGLSSSVRRDKTPMIWTFINFYELLMNFMKEGI